MANSVGETKRAATIIATSFLAFCVFGSKYVCAADVDFAKLYNERKAAYAKLAELPADALGLKEAKAALLERFRADFGTELTLYLLKALGATINASFENAGRVLDSTANLQRLAETQDAAAAEIGRIKGELESVRAKLNERLGTTQGQRDHWNGEVTRLKDRIRSLGGKVRLEGIEPLVPWKFGALYPRRSTKSQPGSRPPREEYAFRVASMTLLAPKLARNRGGFQSAGWGSPATNLPSTSEPSRTLPSTTLPSTESGKVDAQIKNATKQGFNPKSGISVDEFFRNKDMMLRNSRVVIQKSPAALDRMGLGNLKAVTIPSVNDDLPPPGSVTDGIVVTLRAQLKTAKNNFSHLDGQLKALRGQMETLSRRLSALPQDISAATARANTLRQEIGKLGRDAATRLAGLRGKRVIWLNSVTWPAASLETIFGAGKAGVVLDLELFGETTRIDGEWDFSAADRSAKAYLEKIRASAPYKSTILGGAK